VEKAASRGPVIGKTLFRFNTSSTLHIICALGDE
jgi:hypothetical protein